MSDFRLGVKAAVPTALGYVAIGLAFGVVAAASGLSALEVGLMCALVYGGSAQFAMCALIVAGASLGELTLTVFLSWPIRNGRSWDLRIRWFMTQMGPFMWLWRLSGI